LGRDDPPTGEFDFLAAETIADIAAPPVPPPSAEENFLEADTDDSHASRPRPGAGDPYIGRSLGLYRLIQPIAAGGMGCVYLARHTTYGVERAVKVLTEWDPSNHVRFQREAKALLSIDHPNIVKVVDFGTTKDGISFLVMELIPGSTLQDILEDYGAFPEVLAIEMIRQLISALGEVHRRGFMHRDLKPANIIAVETDVGVELKLLDFGLAGMEGGRSLTKAGHVVGTPGFIAPEVITQAGTGPKADLYAAGVILYIMLEGRAPFDAGLTQLLVMHAESPPPRPTKGGPVASLAMMLLEKTPALRPDAEQALELIADIQAGFGAP